MPVPIEEICKELDAQYKKIILSKKNSNNLIDLIKYMHNKKQQVRIHAINLLTKLFINYLQNGDVSNRSSLEIANDNVEVLAEIKFKTWLRKQYENFFAILCENIESSERSDREKSESLDSILQCIKEDTKTTKNSDGEYLFPFDSFHKVLEQILSKVVNLKLVKKYCKYLSFYDLRYFTLKYINENLDKNDSNAIFIENLLNLMSIMPGLIKDDKNNDKVLFALPADGINQDSKLMSVDTHRKLFSDCIFKLLHMKLNSKLFKKILIKFPEKLLPKMSNPLMCTDFLNESYKIGGLVSVLALDCLYALISRYNVEVPEFYKKVYEQLNGSIFQTKYKNRYFVLLDTCLLSTHLSVYLVASFIKKLSRLCLSAPACDINLLLTLIKNLIIRHPSCKPLLHRSNAKSLLTDPFDVDSLNLNDKSIMNSSLWEIEAISNHYVADIAIQVKNMNNLSTNEADIYELLDKNDYESMFEEELNKNYKACPMVFMYDENAFKNNIFYS